MKRYNTDSIEYYLLKHWKFLLFDRTVNLNNKAKFNKKPGRCINYRQLPDMILSIDPELDTAWHLKERYTIFNSSATYESAPQLLGELILEFICGNIPEFEKFTTALSNWRKEICNSFLMYKNRRVSNGVAESLNALISTLLFNTRGIRNVERRRKRIMYAVNKTGFMIKQHLIRDHAITEAYSASVILKSSNTVWCPGSTLSGATIWCGHIRWWSPRFCRRIHGWGGEIRTHA